MSVETVDARWGLVTVQELIDQSPYMDLADDAQAVAERLVMLGHLTMNRDIWVPRLDRYWGAYTDAIKGAALSGSCVDWWCKMQDTMGGVPLSATGLLHEKNQLVRPTLLTPPIEDRAVLRVLDTWALDLVDRCRMWVRARQEARTQTATNTQAEGVAL